MQVIKWRNFIKNKRFDTVAELVKKKKKEEGGISARKWRMFYNWEFFLFISGGGGLHYYRALGLDRNREGS